MESTTSMMKNYLNDDVRMLVTGGSGFIGTNVMDYLIEQNIDTINYDIKPPKKESHFRFWREVDLRNKGILEKEILAFKPTHFSAHSIIFTTPVVFTLKILSSVTSIPVIAARCKICVGLKE